ncbi:Regulatory protein, partial [Lachnellula willkommii]
LKSSSFGLNYYRHCPILDTEVSVKGLHQTSPVLFWTITMIACRWHVSLSYLYDSLLEPYRSLLGRILIEPIHSIESIQAIALRCFWPLSVPRQIDDPSWNYCGLLTNAAMKMGLNKAQRDFQATPPKSTVGIRILTWIACVQANCANGWTSGVAVSAEVLTKFTIAPSLPTKVERGFALKVQIMQKTENSCSTLTSLRENLSSWAFVQSQCRDLDTLRDAYGNEELWTVEMDVLAFGGQLRLYMLQLERGERLQNVSQAVGDQDNASSQLSFINLAYMTATQLVHSFSTMLEGARRHDNTDIRSPQRHFPKHYFGLLLLAMAFLFKVKVFHAQEVTSSQSRTDTSLRTVYEILSSWSGGELDEPGRAIRLMDVLARNEKELELRLKESTSEGRQGLAILDNLISTAKTIRERAQTATEITSTDNNEMVDHVPGLDTDLGLIEGWQDSLLDWNFPWGLDLPWADPYDFDIGTA